MERSEAGPPTVVWAADFEPADPGEHREVGEAAQAEQDAAEGVDGAGRLVEQPPGRRQEHRWNTWNLQPVDVGAAKSRNASRPARGSRGAAIRASGAISVCVVSIMESICMNPV